MGVVSRIVKVAGEITPTPAGTLKDFTEMADVRPYAAARYLFSPVPWVTLDGEIIERWFALSDFTIW